MTTSPTPGSRCLGWFCGVRDLCALHMLESDVTLVRWWQPEPDKTGLDCPHFVEVRESP